MNSLLPNFNDPIVSILLILGIFFIIATLSYAYTIYKQDKKRKELLEFIDNFETQESSFEINSLQYHSSIKKPLALLAYAYLKSGDYSKAIEIYIYLIKNSKDNSFLLYLAKAYLKAGFLKRAEKIYLEILENYPRDIEALYNLELIYEKLNQLNEATEVLDILNNLKEDTNKLYLHLNILELKNSFKSQDEKFQELIKLYKNNEEWIVLREMFKIKPSLAWSYFKDKYFNNLIDILNRVSKVDKNIVEESINLKKLYSIKELFKYNIKENSDNFYIDLLYNAKNSGFNDGELEFIYICENCKNRYPLEFSRCPNCHKAYEFKIEVKIAKKEKRDYSLQ